MTASERIREARERKERAALIARILDPRVRNIGAVGAALVAAARSAW